MGQKWTLHSNPSLVWMLRGQPELHPNPEQPIKFQFKTRPRRRKIRGEHAAHGEVPTNSHERPDKRKFGYDIEDIDQFLAKASLAEPANIPVVLSDPTVLYQTRVGGFQAEIALPLGMVVNAVFRNRHWLYAQTPHGEEGYIAYMSCIPLGIIPSPDNAPCWETSTDVFPRPSGNMTDTEKLSTRSDGHRIRRCKRRSRRHSVRGEHSVDRLYLRAASDPIRRLLVIDEDYTHEGNNTITVKKGDVVSLLSTNLQGWFWVRRIEGAEGFIPAAIAGYGYL